MYYINNNDFQILFKDKRYLKLLDDILENVPRKDMYFKDLMRNKSYDVLNYIIKCSYENDNQVINEYKINIKTNIAMIDFMIDRLYDKAYISEKTVSKLSLVLVEINKMVSSWLHNKESIES